MHAAKFYQYVIVNDEVNEAQELLQSIILAERAKGHRLPNGKPITFIDHI